MITEEKKLFRWILIASLICVSAAVFSLLLPFLVVIIPITLSVLWIKKGAWSALLPYLFSVAVVWLFFGYVFAVLYILATLPASIVTSVFLAKKKRMFESVMAVSFASALGCLVFIWLISLKTGENIVVYLTSQFNTYLSADESITQLLYLSLNDQTGLMTFTQTGVMPDSLASVTLIQMRNSIITAFGELLPIFIPSAIVLFALLSGFFSFFCAHAWLKKHGADVVPAADFKDLRLPQTASFALGIMVILSFVLSLFGLSVFNNVFTLLMLAFILIFSIQGCALFIFLYKKKRMGLIACIFLIIIGILLNAMYWVGFFESLFRIRERITLNDTGNRSL